MHRKARKLQWAGALFLALFALLYSKEEVTLSGNESSRFGVIQAVGEQGVFYLDHTNFIATVDKTARHGHWYSDKPLPLSFAAGAVYAVLHRSFGLNFTDHRMLSIYLVNLIFSGGCQVLLFVWLFRHLRRSCRGKLEYQFLLALAMCVSTQLLSYSVVLNNHTPAALAGLGAMIALWHYERCHAPVAVIWAAVAAGAAGWLDIPFGFFLGLAVFFAVWRLAPPPLRWRHLGLTAGIGGGMAVLFLLLNFVAYGTVLPLYISGDEATYQFFYRGGRLPEFIFHSLFGFRGFFSYQPMLLLAIAALWYLRRRKLLRCSELFLLAGAGATALFYLINTNEYGGASYGYRYLIPLIPLLWVVIARWLLAVSADRCQPAGKRRVLGATVAVLTVWGLVTSLVGAYAPFCVASEGERTPPKHFSAQLSSPFWGNLLVMSFEHDPDAALTRRLIEHYGDAVSYSHIFHSGMMMRRPALIAQLQSSDLGGRITRLLESAPAATEL